MVLQSKIEVNEMKDWDIFLLETIVYGLLGAMWLYIIVLIIGMEYK